MKILGDILKISRAFPGPVNDLGTKSRGIELPREHNGVFRTGSSNHGTEIFCLCGIRQQRD